MRKLRVVLGAAAFLAAVANYASAAGDTAVAELKLANGTVAGTIKLTETSAGMLLKIEFKGLPPGPHALQVHEFGKCEGDFTSAGGIYNPLGAKHGFLNEEGPMAGDLPNVIAASDGTVAAEVLSPFLHLSKDAEDSLFDEDGSAVVLFEKADDYQNDPEGGAGSRIACGVLKTQ